MLYPDGALLKGSGPQVYVVEDGRRRWIPDPDTLFAIGGGWGQIQHIPDQTLATVPEGDQLVSIHAVRRFAPKVYLHAYDNHRPTSVERFMSSVALYGPQGQMLAGAVNSGVLAANNGPGHYMAFASGEYPTAHNDFSTGDPIVGGRCHAPMYVKSFGGPGYFDLVYSFFYAFNGFQTFRTGILSGLSTKKRNFTWARFARHLGDWEHVTVRIARDASRISGVYYGQHGGSAYVERPPLEDGHPVVYSALSSHASYPERGTFTQGHVLHPPGLLPIGWLKAVDTTEDDGLRCYRQPEPFFERVEWAPWAFGEGLSLLDGNVAAAQWLNFQGHWGPPVMDNTHIDRPPSMPENAENRLFDWAKILRIAIPQEYWRGEGPRSPKQQGWWRDESAASVLGGAALVDEEEEIEVAGDQGGAPAL